MRRSVIISIPIAAALMAAAFGVPDRSVSVWRRDSNPGQAAVSAVPEAYTHAPVGDPRIDQLPINADNFIEELRFRMAANIAPAPVAGLPVAGVVNHHALSSDLLARFFKTLGAARPDTRRIILLSPDHFKRGSAPISVGQSDYSTHGRRIRIDTDLADRLSSAGIAHGERGLFDAEHGVGTLIPFLAAEFPEATTLPLVLRADVSREDAEHLGRTLAGMMDPQTLIIISADMSHYLPEEDALRHDTETLLWLTTHNARAFQSASDDWTDNGPSFVALFTMFEALGQSPTFTLLDHSISTRYGGPAHDTTTYITGFWMKKSDGGPR